MSRKLNKKAPAYMYAGQVKDNIANITVLVKYPKVLFLLLLLLTIFPIGRIVWQKWDYYLSPFDLRRAQGLYDISQYVKEEGASWIADEILFAYAGWYYINGGSPILVNPENPPLGKYIIGLSIKLFNNEKIPSLILGFLSLFSFFLFCRLFFKKTWIALLPVAFFSWERLFREQLMYIPLLELFALTFLNFFFYFFIKAEENNRYFLMSSFFLGTLWATRPWMATTPLIVSAGLFLASRKEIKKFFYWLFSFSIAVFVLLLSYLKLFFEGWSVYKVLSVQKWILWYHQSRLINFGSVWPFIYARRWYVWWGEKPFLPVEQWNIFWPIFTTLALIFSVAVLLKVFGFTIRGVPPGHLGGVLKFDRRITVLCLWVVFYLTFLSFGNINSRYVFYLLPFCYLLGIYFLNSVLIGKKRRGIVET